MTFEGYFRAKRALLFLLNSSK